MEVDLDVLVNILKLDLVNVEGVTVKNQKGTKAIMSNLTARQISQKGCNSQILSSDIQA